MNGTSNYNDSSYGHQAPSVPLSVQGPSGNPPTGGQPSSPAQPSGTYPPPPPHQPQGSIGPMVNTIQSRDPRLKSAPLASFLSIIPGLGQVYVGYYQRGFVHAMTVAGVISLLAVFSEPPVLPFAPLFMAFFWLYNIIDAGRRATYYNQVLAGGEIPDVPEDFKMPGIRGSILGGLILIAFGGIALSYTRFDFSLAWVEEWWPVIPIALGVFLLAKAIQERGSTDSL